jgi:molybdopterin-guanine dinucleotide biosynthesis protein A
MNAASPDRHDAITALILAGGRGARMGNADKGLQPFRGQPLVRTVLERLAGQTLRPGRIAISANRNANHYAGIGAAFNAPVWPDGTVAQPGNQSDPSPIEFSGPLAGVLAGLERAATLYLLTVPCDAPLLPLSLCERLMQSLQDDPEADLAAAFGLGGPAAPAQLQPMFCLLRRDRQERLAHDLSAWLSAGKRQARAWIARQRHVIARFDTPADDPFGFANANTPEQLQQLEDC